LITNGKTAAAARCLSGHLFGEFFLFGLAFAVLRLIENAFSGALCMRTCFLVGITFFLFMVVGNCTTVIVFETKYGIIIGADQQTLQTTSQGPIDKRGTASKLALVQDRMAVASIGLESVVDSEFLYDFQTWITGIGKGLPPGSSPEALALLIKMKSAALFANFDPEIKKIRNIQAKFTTCQSFLQYVVIGYKEGTPEVLIVTYNIDWIHEHLIGPDVYTEAPNNTSAMLIYGRTMAIEDLANSKSYVHRRATTLFPAITKKVLSQREISLEEATSFVRTLLRVENEIEPDSVGGKTTIATIPVTGTTRLSEYDGEVHRQPAKPLK
jgi:hypothetical protein